MTRKTRVLSFIITSCLVLASLFASAAPKTAALVREAENLDFTPEQLSRLGSLCEFYDAWLALIESEVNGGK